MWHSWNEVRVRVEGGVRHVSWVSGRDPDPAGAEERLWWVVSAYVRVVQQVSDGGVGL